MLGVLFGTHCCLLDSLYGIVFAVEFVVLMSLGCVLLLG